MRRFIYALLMLVTIGLMTSCQKKGQPPLIPLGSDKAIPMTFEPFGHASTIEPGKTTYDKAIKILGKPIALEHFNDNKDRIYKTWIDFDCGISLITEKEAKDSAVVDAVILQKTYKGESSSGLKLGLTKVEAVKILDSRYRRAYQDNETIIYTKGKNGAVFQVYFDSGYLQVIKLFKTVNK
ncbi:hypothetical protein [Roseivirga sp. E12]|uniref:hypothetical protein n=1 Tax=Roseivirga sp. E12 TaxID=2819237 RepID=UPI001ABD112E|nr:hypothetical protein [Roseivirga sp. E12]MBO3697354.1 hypothetical protein [Roseivirga sp. E12]